MTPAYHRDSSFSQVARLHWLALIIALALVGGVIGYNLLLLRHRMLDQEQSRLMTQAKVIGNNLEHQLEVTSRALRGVVDDARILTDPRNRVLANQRLTILADAIPGIRTLVITDAAGVVIACNRPKLIGRSVALRQYFNEPRCHPNAATLYISPPFRSYLHNYLFDITKLLPGKGGRLGGVVSAGIDPDYFAEILQSALYAPDMVSAIVHADGARFMIMPFQGGQIGTNMAVSGSLFSRHQASGKAEDVYTDSYCNIAGEHRMVVLSSVQPPALKMDRPLVVIISRRPAAILEGWRYQLIFQGLLFLLTGVGSSLGLLLVHRRQKALERAARRTEELVGLRYQLLDYASQHSVHELLQYALDEVCRITASPVGFCHFVDPDQQGLTLQAWSSRTLKEFCRADGIGMHYGIDQAGVWADCVRTKAPVIHNEYAALPDKKGLPPGHAPVVRELTVPVIRDERVVAVLGVGNKESDYGEKDMVEVDYLADVTWEIIDGRRSQEELRQANELLATQARIDFLTGVYNRRMFDSLLAAEMTRACRYNEPLSLIMLDLDHFKQVNDSLGHRAGDQVLQKLAELLSGRIRSHDVLSRWGGEEFLILTPQSDITQAITLAEGLRELVEQYDFGSGLRITISFGVTSHCCGESAEAFVARADTALYEAKRNGRNRVEQL